MKKILIFFLLWAQLLSMLPGCGARNEAVEGTSMQLYYEVESAAGLDVASAVAPETRKTQAATMQAFLEEYFKGPISEGLRSPFPAGTRVLHISADENGVILKMSGEFFTLMGVDMSIASCCIAKTLSAYAGIQSVTLSDELDTIHLEVQPEHYLLSNDITKTEDESFTVYFSNADHRYLVAESRAAILSENETEVAYLMRQLLEGPESSQLMDVIPEGAEPLSMETSDGICFLDFPAGFYRSAPEDAYEAYMTVYGIVNTLTGIPEIQSIQFLSEGVPAEKYGMFSLSEPVTRNPDAIGPVRSASGELDVNIYVRSVENGEMFGVPCRVKQTVSQPLAEAVLTRVLSYEAFQGFENPIPFGTELLNISVSGSVCYVDVSEKFIPPEDEPETERAAVWALVASLTDLDNIAFVALSVNGDNGGLNFVDISESLTRESVSLH